MIEAFFAPVAPLPVGDRHLPRDRRAYLRAYRRRRRAQAGYAKPRAEGHTHRGPCGASCFARPVVPAGVDTTALEDFLRRRRAQLLQAATFMCGDAAEGEDLLQEASLRLFRNWGRYAGGKESYKLAQKVMANLRRDQFKLASYRNGRRTDSLDAAAAEDDERTPHGKLAAPDAAPDERLLRQWDVLKVRRVVRSLKPHHQAVLLAMLDSTTWTEAAKRSGLKYGTFGSTFTRAAAAFRKAWERKRGRPKINKGKTSC